MPQNKDRTLRIYKQLVDELLKETSDEKLVKDLMQKLSMEYSSEKVDRLTTVLAFNPRPDSFPNEKPLDPMKEPS